MNDVFENNQREIGSRIDQIGVFEDSAVLRHSSMRQWIAILRECSDNSKWRNQLFDKDGFVGHRVHPSKDAAIASAAHSGFVIRDDDALDRLEKTQQFRLGNEISTELSLMNSAEITFKEFMARVTKLKLEYSCP